MLGAGTSHVTPGSHLHGCPLYAHACAKIFGRITNLDLAERVGLSSAPCLRRVRALENSGVLRRYVALLDPRKVGLNLEIAVDVRLKEQTRELMTSFERRIVRMPEVVECCLTAGEGTTH